MSYQQDPGRSPGQHARGYRTDRAPAATPGAPAARRAVDETADVADALEARWLEDAAFQERLRDLLALLRPHRVERLAGWREYRVRGHGFRVNVAWDPQARRSSDFDESAIPGMVDVLEALLVGSAPDQDEIEPAEEFARYAQVVRELSARVEELRSRYE